MAAEHLLSYLGFWIRRLVVGGVGYRYVIGQGPVVWTILVRNSWVVGSSIADGYGVG